MSRQAFHRLVRRIIGEPGFVRMDADGCVDERKFIGELDSGIERRRAVAVADRHHRLYAGLAGASDHLLAICVKLLAIEMCVRIYKHD